MSFNATIHPEFHNEVHFEEETEVKSFCCFSFFRSKPKNKKNVTLSANKNEEITQLANREPFKNIKLKSDDSIDTMGSVYISDSTEISESVTSEKIGKIFTNMYQGKREFSDSSE